MVDDLPNRLMECGLSGQPWPAQIERTLARTRPGNLLRLFRQLGLRNEMIAPEGLPLLDDLADQARPGRSHGHKPSVSLPRLLFMLRAQWAHLTSAFSLQTKDKLDHVWQVQACPIGIRKRMTRLVGLTFLPGRRRESFPDGEEFVPLRFLNVLSLGFRRHRNWPDNLLLDMLDIKVHRMAVDPDSGQVSLVPLYARYFNYAPFQAAEKTIVEADNYSVIRSGLDLHRAMEWSAVTGSSIRDEPEFPRLYLGFAKADDIELEVTTDLKITAWRYIQDYVKAGKPEVWEPCQDLASVRDKLGDRLRPTWADYERILGKSDAEFVLCSVLDAETVLHEGLTLRPLEFFHHCSPQFPVRKSIKIYARMASHLMRRDTLKGVATFDDGGRFTGVDGVIEPMPRFARLQILRAPDRSYWAGSTGPVEWDLRSVPEVSRNRFRELHETRPFTQQDVETHAREVSEDLGEPAVDGVEVGDACPADLPPVE